MKKTLILALLSGTMMVTPSLAIAQDSEVIMRRPLPGQPSGQEAGPLTSGGEESDPEEETPPEETVPPEGTGPCDDTIQVPGSSCPIPEGEAPPRDQMSDYTWTTTPWPAATCGETVDINRTVGCEAFSYETFQSSVVDVAYCHAYSWEGPPSSNYSGNNANCEHEMVFEDYAPPGDPIEMPDGTLLNAGMFAFPDSCERDNTQMRNYKCVNSSGQDVDMAFCYNDITNGGISRFEVGNRIIDEAIAPACSSARWVDNYNYYGCNEDVEEAYHEPLCVGSDGRVLEGIEAEACPPSHSFGPEGLREVGSCSATYHVDPEVNSHGAYCNGPLIGDWDENVENGVEVRDYVAKTEDISSEKIDQFCSANGANCCEYINVIRSPDEHPNRGVIRAFRDPDAVAVLYQHNPIEDTYYAASHSSVWFPDDPQVRENLPEYQEPIGGCIGCPPDDEIVG